METKPTHEQAQLHLQIYEMRREARLRQARDWFFKNYFVDNLEDAMRIAAPGTETGAFAMKVFSYWEQACALLNYGLLHEDLFFETAASFSGFGSASDRLSSRVGSGLRISSSLRTWKKLPTAMSPGLKTAHLGISLLCDNLRNRCAQLGKAA